MSFQPRLRAAGLAAAIHFLGSMLVAAIAALLVFGVWYPFPYRELAGGRELFLLVVLVDIVLGPLLTLVLFAPSKLPKELWRDLTVVVVLQLCALGYGVWTVWQARPLFLVAELDRFKVVSRLALKNEALDALPTALQPGKFSGPLTVAIREPKDLDEKNSVLFDTLQGGRDYGERPDFYVPYEGQNARKSLNRAQPLAVFLQKRPDQSEAAQKLAVEKKADISQWMYLPVIARQDWVAVLDKQGQIQGFLKGDGF